MRIQQETIRVRTRSRFELVDVTGRVEEWLGSIKAETGILAVYSPHTTAGVIVNEAEPRLMDDIIKLLQDLTKPDSSWRHNMIDDNAHAHLGQILVGNSRIIPVANGRLSLGTWQSIMLVEMDGPRERRLTLIYIGL